MKWQASAPTNIAVIKYMGKKAVDINLPANASLSYTLGNLRSFVEIELSSDLRQDQWEPLQAELAPFVPVLPSAAQERFLRHLNFIKQHFNYHGHFIVRSANNFPAGCGLASSAASFAALTLCAVKALTELTHAEPLTLERIAHLSRQGSGSSCRSFFGPWVLWKENQVSALDLPYKDLLHQVIVVSEHHKLISSSEAHKRVVSGALYSGRNARAEQRLEQLLLAFDDRDWLQAQRIIWQEFWDMHALFETAAQPFGYLEVGSVEVLAYLRSYWENKQDGPLITLDAGPNVHLLFRPDQTIMAQQIRNELAKKFLVL